MPALLQLVRAVVASGGPTETAKALLASIRDQPRTDAEAAALAPLLPELQALARGPAPYQHQMRDDQSRVG